MKSFDRVLMGALAVAGLAFLGVAAWVLVVLVGGSDTDLERADQKCSTSKLDLETGDDGDSMRIVAKNSDGVAVMACVFAELDAPDSLIGKLQDTRGLDGRQEDSWGDYTASWTYLPEDGYHVVIEK